MGEMIQSSTVRSNKQLFTSSMLQLSNLFYHAYVNPSTMVNNFPVKVFGVFGTKESHVLTEKFVPFLVEEIERTESEHVRLSAILALGKTGHLKGLKTLVKEIERASLQTTSATKVTMTEARRTIATYALKRMAKMNPTEIRPILMSIIVNPVESAEVRIAATSILPFAQPTTAELQKLAIRSWMEPSEQVASFIFSTLRSLAYSQVPELKTVGLKARSVLPLIKGERFGIQHSHNVHVSSFVEYLRTLVNNKYELVNSKESMIPHKLSMKTVYYGKLVWDQRFLRVDQFILVVDKSPQVLNKGRDMDIVGVLDAKPLTLDEWQDGPGLQTDSPELWNLGVSRRPQGGEDEGSNLLRWLHPRADGQLLELSSGWLGEWEDRNSSNPDLSRLNWVDNDGHKDWANFSWVHLGHALQSIGGNGPAGLSHGDLGGRGSLEGSTLNFLDKGLESRQVTGLAQSKDGRKTDMLRFSPLNLFNKEWDELLSQDMGLLSSKDTEDLDWEVVDHGGWVDISMVG